MPSLTATGRPRRCLRCLPVQANFLHSALRDHIHANLGISKLCICSLHFSLSSLNLHLGSYNVFPRKPGFSTTLNTSAISCTTCGTVTVLSCLMNQLVQLSGPLHNMRNRLANFLFQGTFPLQLFLRPSEHVRITQKNIDRATKPLQRRRTFPPRNCCKLRAPLRPAPATSLFATQS